MTKVTVTVGYRRDVPVTLLGKLREVLPSLIAGGLSPEGKPSAEIDSSVVDVEFRMWEERDLHNTDFSITVEVTEPDTEATSTLLPLHVVLPTIKGPIREEIGAFRPSFSITLKRTSGRYQEVHIP